MRSSGWADRLVLERAVPTTVADVAALRASRHREPLTLDDYLRFLGRLEPASPAALRHRRGPMGPPFRLRA
jgi:hypothetical protein